MHEILATATNYILNIVWDMWYIWIFVMMVIESSFFPFPSEIAMIPAWFLASVWKMNFSIALISWTLWAIVWASINYFLWKNLWWPIIKKLIKNYWKYIFISEEHYNKSEIYFQKHWWITTFLARFIPAVRQLISIPAWIFKMNFIKFTLYTWTWAFFWNLILMIIWYIAWENKDLIKEYSYYALLWILLIAIIIWSIYYFKNKTKSKQRTIFIWDVQWCYNELKDLLKKIDIKENDKVYFVWDLINKWPKSYKVLKFVYKNRKRFKSIVWNHEINFLRYLDWKWCKEHNKKEFEYLKEKLNKKPEILQFLREMPRYIIEDNFIMVHAWIYPNKKIQDHSIDEITKVRDINWKPWYEFYEWTKKIIYWHRAIDWIRIRKNTIWLDTWCVYWKSLTAYILETWEIYTQQAEEIYVNVYNKYENKKSKKL